MATIKWQGGAVETAQVTQFTPTNVEIGDIFKIDLSDDAGNSHEISFTATAATVANVTAGLQSEAADAKAAGYEPWTEVTATDTGSEVNITADTAGVPFYSSTTATDGGGTDDQTLTATTTTANSGPNDYNTADNWDTGTVPAAGDDVEITGEVTDSILYGLDQSGTQINSFIVHHAFTGHIGQDTAPLQIDSSGGSAEVHIGYIPELGSGSGRINLDTGSGTISIHVYNTKSTGVDSGKNPVRILHNDASTDIQIDDGRVGLGTDQPGSTGEIRDVATSGYLNIASGMTIDNIITNAKTTRSYTGATTAEVLNGGKFYKYGSANSATTKINAGIAYIRGTGQITSELNINGGSAYVSTTGTIAQLNVTGYCEVLASLTITNTNLYAGASLICDADEVTFTNDISLVHCDINDLADLQIGANHTLAIT